MPHPRPAVGLPKFSTWLLALLWIVAGSACSGDRRKPVATKATEPTALRIATSPHHGATALDHRIRAAQEQARSNPSEKQLEVLARCFIAKARASADPGYYRLAEAAADAMPAPEAPAALLVRGHVRHALHDFANAEAITRKLVEQRGMFLDLGLLGDVLLDRGQFEEAQDCYQRMLNLKPCLQSYARAAELRWRRGDVEGSLELLGLATRAGSRRSPESLAWAFSRQGELALQAGQPGEATDYANQALEHVDGYAAALAVRARADLASGNHERAVLDLATAAERSPLPAHQWAYADALRAAGRTDDAHAVERTMRQTGEREDPRTFAVWLATQSDAPGDEDARLALQLAEREFQQRQDCLTSDALAWAHLQCGELPQATQAIEHALSLGSRDARVHLHAAEISIASGDRESARRHGKTAAAARTALMPSERQKLDSLLAML